VALPPSVIEDFFARELDTFEEVRKFTRAEIYSDIKDLRPRHKFYGDKAYLHQLVCFVIGVYNPHFLFFLDMGMGKSRVILDLLSYQLKCGKLQRALVVVPNITNIDNWVEEAKIFAPKLKVVPLYGSSEQRFQTLEDCQDGNLFIINSGGLTAMFSTGPKTNKKGKKESSKPNVRLINKYTSMFQAYIVDESEVVKNIHSLIYRISLYFSAVAEWDYGLTGTPMNRDPEDFWSQFYMVDRGATLGNTLTFFRAMFYKQSPGHFSKFIYKFDKAKEKAFYQMIQNRSIAYNIEDAMDMPRKLYIKRKLPMSPEALPFYDIVAGDAKVARGNYQLMKSAYTKARQISSGYVTFKDEDTGKKRFVDFVDNPKMDELIEIMKTIPESRKIIICHHFIKTGRLISDRLAEEKFPHSRLWSGQKKKVEVVRDFKSKKGKRTLVMNAQSGGRGLNLQRANYLIIFESPDSASARKQLEARIWRGRQKFTCFIYDLVVNGTKDAAILAANKSHTSLLKRLVNGKDSW
jgi:SNF2 family DNA or RNA helicase|tara:strand:- start:11824 stop:13383 length:1560 start_codon:yes stop_codon:yes gene_type:complete